MSLPQSLLAEFFSVFNIRLMLRIITNFAPKLYLTWLVWEIRLFQRLPIHLGKPRQAGGRAGEGVKGEEFKYYMCLMKMPRLCTAEEDSVSSTSTCPCDLLSAPRVGKQALGAEGSWGALSFGGTGLVGRGGACRDAEGWALVSPCRKGPW